MIRSRLADLVLSLLLYHVHFATAQRWRQTFSTPAANGVAQTCWQPDAGSPCVPPVQTSKSFFLEYNCYYMENNCQNARLWLAGHMVANQVRTEFAYDYKGSRRDNRRDESCPRTWINNGRCPERGMPGQARSYRWNRVTSTGEFWPTVDLAPGSNNLIADDATGRPSEMIYSCDEFPPATWIQGGLGANTRCAAFRCDGTPYSSEQQFQAISHGVLRSFMQGRVPRFDINTEVVIFFFRMTNANNEIPVSIGYTDGLNPGEEIASPFTGPSKKRGIEGAESIWNGNLTFDQWIDWGNSVTMDELRQNHGLIEHHILVNDTKNDPNFMLRRELGNDIFGRWTSEFDDARTFDAKIDFIGQNISFFAEQQANHVVSSQNSRRHQIIEHPIEKLLSSIHGRESTSTPLLLNVTESALQRAVRIVEQAISDATRLNAARFENVARNKYGLAPGTVIGASGGVKRRKRNGPKGVRDDQDSLSLPPPPPLLDVTADLAAAAALVAEADAAGITGLNVSRSLHQRATAGVQVGSFWMESIARKGTVPWGNDPNYKVFRNVVADYGAKGDGKTDDTAAIQNAMNDGKRCGENCHGSTTKNAIVYFPPGTYLVSKTIEMPFGTQLIGDAVNRPTILAASRFIGLGVISTDKYTGGGAGSDGLDEEYYVNTANFYRQIRNVIIDVSGTRPVQGVSGIHYQVAQATSMQNVDIIAKTGTNQRGMFAENGSGGQISDVNFKGGNFCIYGGNQQFTAQRLTFDGCDTAVRTIWDWGWIWKSITVKNTRIGFQLLSDGSMTTSSSSVKASSGNIGSASFVDSNFVSVGTAVMIAPLNSAPGSGSTGVILENVGFSGVTVGVADSSGKTILAGGDQRLKEWATGPMYLGGGRRFVSGETVPAYPRQATLLDTSKPNSPYYERARPQYETRSASDFVHLKDLGAKGDGITDDTAAVQRALDNNIGRILFVDAGTYILTDTVTIPAGSILVGETWSQFAASGDNFKDATKPRVMLRVGRYGDIGSVEMQDLIFTTQGPTAGAILVEWNIKAGSQGSAALWDCHARVGGAIGTKLTDKECPAITTGTDPGCQGASMLFHLTTQASGYFENMWLWTADHNIDDVELSNAKNPMIQNSVYSARGMLIESREATWLYGTASEHSVYYQYNFNGASNIYAGMVQTESPYYQPVPKPPEPFANAVGQFAGDPTYRCGNDFDGCDASWAIIVRKSENIHFAGAGVYSWFSSYTQDCIDSQTCQKALILAEKNKGNVRFQHLITIGAKYMIVQDGKGITAADNLNVKSHPRWSQISILDLAFVKADHQSPFSATVIPLPHTTVPPRSTLTLSEPIQSDIVQLPYNGNQNDAPGPGVSSCSACSFFRLITSTCCGTGGSLGNPLLIPKGVTTYIPIELPAGFVPGQAFVGQDGVTYPKGVALPRNVIIPVGTTFANGFTIPAGQALASGEDNGPPPGDLIWIDPKIWQQPNPKVACDIFPCTFKFPPWTGATSTLDYPKMTVTNGTFTTTITRGPITITEWIFDPYTISAPSQSTTSFAAPQATTTSSTTVAPIFFIWPPPRFGSTSTWPWVTYTQSGIVMSTRPPTTGSATGGKGTGGGGGVGVVPTPHPPPPPPGPSPPPPPTGSWPVATITVYPLRPSPTVHDCDFPDPECPNPPGKTDGPGFTMPEPQPGEVDDDDEDDDEEEGTCPLVSNGGGSGSGGSGGSGSGGGGGGSGGGNNGGGGGGSSSPTPTYNNPDPGTNTVDCYNSGQTASNEQMALAADSFCSYNLAPAAKTMSTFGPGYTAFAKKNPNGASIRIEFNFEVLAGCAWKFDMEQCRKYFRVPIDSCNCNGFDGKQGGVARNNCLAWRVDPNTGT